MLAIEIELLKTVKITSLDEAIERDFKRLLSCQPRSVTADTKTYAINRFDQRAIIKGELCNLLDIQLGLC